MSFTTSCFIRKNTKKLRNKLNILGYDIENEVNNDYDGILTHYRYGADYWCAIPFRYELGIPEKTVDCGENEDLFFAIASLRDDDISLNDKINEINKKYGTKIEFRR